MTKEETKKAIEVMQAWVDGKKIEYRHEGEPEWITVAILTSWDWKNWDYRIKPEPREVIAWEKDGRLYFPEHHFPETEWSEDGYRKILLREVIE